MTDQGQALPAGWKRDPSGRYFGRYWDGERWTDQVVSAEKVQSVDPLPPPPPPPDPSMFPDDPPPMAPRPAMPSAADPKGRGRNQVLDAIRGWPRWAKWTAGVAVVVLLIAAASSGGDEDETVSAGQSETTKATLSHVQASTTPTIPPPTPPPTVATTTTTTTPPQPVDIATFTGSSDKNTETFAVRNPWRIRWRITGGAGVGIEVFDQGGTRIEYISTDPGQDETIIRRACTCYLKLSPFGSSYTITINGVRP